MSERKSLRELAARAAKNANAGGWECPHCGCKDTKVRKTWHPADPAIFARRSRVCGNCGKSAPSPTTEVEVPKGFKVVVVPDDDEERACA